MVDHLLAALALAVQPLDAEVALLGLDPGGGGTLTIRCSQGQVRLEIFPHSRLETYQWPQSDQGWLTVDSRQPERVELVPIDNGTWALADPDAARRMSLAIMAGRQLVFRQPTGFTTDAPVIWRVTFSFTAFNRVEEECFDGEITTQAAIDDGEDEPVR